MFPSSRSTARGGTRRSYRGLPHGRLPARNLGTLGNATICNRLLTIRQLKRLEIYAAFFHVAGVMHHIDVGLPAPLTHTKVFLFDNSAERGDFGERERTILELVRPHLIRRYEDVRVRRRAAAALASLEASGEPLVLLNETGGADFATTRRIDPR